MKHLKRINEKGYASYINNVQRIKKAELDAIEQEKKEIKGDSEQDVVHWEIIIEDGVPYLKIATDDDYYYVKVKCQKKFDREK